MGILDWLFGGKGVENNSKEFVAKTNAGSIVEPNRQWKEAGNPDLDGDEYWLDLVRQDLADGVYPNGVKKVWSSCMDGSVCPLCAYLEGIALDIDEAFEVGDYSVQSPPLHQGCRCSLVFEEPRNLKGYTALGQKISVLKNFLAELNKGSDAVSILDYYNCTLELCEEILNLQTGSMKKSEQRFIDGLPKKLDSLRKNKDKILKAAIDRNFEYTVKYASDLKTSRGKIRRVKNFFYDPLIECGECPEQLISYAKSLFDEFVAQQKNQQRKEA